MKNTKRILRRRCALTEIDSITFSISKDILYEYECNVGIKTRPVSIDRRLLTYSTTTKTIIVPFIRGIRRIQHGELDLMRILFKKVFIFFLRKFRYSPLTPPRRSASVTARSPEPRYHTPPNESTNKKRDFTPKNKPQSADSFWYFVLFARRRLYPTCVPTVGGKQARELKFRGVKWLEMKKITSHKKRR